MNIAAAAEAGRHGPEQGVGQPLFDGLYVRNRQTSVKRPHATGDIEADAAGRDDAFVGVERCNTADREAVAPVRVRHRVGGLDDPG